MAAKRLTIITSATGFPVGGGMHLDKKFVAGMERYTSSWDGPVRCLIPSHPRQQPFGGVFLPEELPFEARLFASARDELAATMSDTDVALISGDNADYLFLADLCRNTKTAVAFTIEYTLKTRMQINSLDSSRSALRKLRGALWLLSVERRRRAAFRKAAGLQANGYPAFEAFRPLNPSTIWYLDNRMDDDICATPDEQSRRHAHLTDGGPLRLLHSGRLEAMKGSQDLVPIARALRDRGVDFHL
ncbi:hypothetical protein, partial [Paracoccus sp. (in: a-proteobacteria)]|uniref:hypothetical protein n=1 Tax=Paracoccus sp. TaxID=267 RepID=UPI003A853A21